jgi:two-component system, sensor histidine kinase PdtaS
MKKLLFFLLLWNLSSRICAQDSPEARFYKQLDKAESFVFENIDAAIENANTAFTIANELKNDTLKFITYRTIGYIYEENSRYPEAQKAYQNALKLAENHLTEQEKCAIYTDWAILHKKMGHYTITYDYHWLTIKLAEKLQDWEQVENGYNGLGTMYAMTSQYEKAIDFYLKSIEAAKKWNNNAGVVLTEENISGIYLNVKNYDLARQNIEKTQKLAVSLGDSARIAASYNLLGDLEMALGKQDIAHQNYQKANIIFEKIGDKSKLAESHLSLGYFYFQQKKFDEANYHFNECNELSAFFTPYCSADFYCKYGKTLAAQNKPEKAISAFTKCFQITDSLGIKDIARDNHLAFAEFLKTQKQFEKAYKHLQLAQNLSDTLYEEKQLKSISEARFKFDLEKRDTQIAEQSHQLIQSSWVRTILIGLLLLVLVLFFFVWRQMRTKLKDKNHIELLMKELHHRVKNNLQTVTSIMRLQARHIADPSVSAVLAESRSRLEAISMIHQQLYRSDEVQSVNFRLFLDDLIDKLQLTYGMMDKELKANIQLQNELINVDLALPLGLIINELLTNSFKYAYPSVEEPKLTIKINDHNFYYADNGVGLPNDFSIENNKSFGTKLISSLANQIRGKFKFGNQDGMFFNLTFN